MTALNALHADPTGATLGLDLPPGRFVHSDAGPLLWISAARAAPPTLIRIRPAAGLYPVLVGGREGEWDPDLMPDLITDPGRHDVRALLADWWDTYVDVEGDQPADPEAVDPFGLAFPGLAIPTTSAIDPEFLRERIARAVLTEHVLTEPRLALVPAQRGADVPAAIGWSGAVNYDTDAAVFSAVLRTWEDRFGARLVALEDDVLHLSVAAPPTTPEQALAVAAEHFAFCPDNVWQRGARATLRDYAKTLLDAPHWSFWWD